MKKSKRMLRKFLLLTSSALLLVSLTVGVTLAYLTDTDYVTNTFTVGNVEIRMDEALVNVHGQKIDADGNVDETSTARTKENEYHLLPGQTYVKDPTIYVAANSEDCYVFVKVENGLAAIEDTTMHTGSKGSEWKTTIAWQIDGEDRDFAQKQNHWNQLKNAEGENVEGVYYKEHTKSAEEAEYVVFTSFTLKGEGLVNGTADEGEISLDSYKKEKIKVTGYAIQAAGFDDAYTAWVAGNWQ